MREAEAWVATTKEKEVSITTISAELASIRGELVSCRRQLTVSEEQFETNRRCWSAEKTAMEASVAVSKETIDALKRQQQEGLNRQGDLERQIVKAEEEYKLEREKMRACREKASEKEKERLLVIRDWEEKHRMVTGKLEVSIRQGKEWEYRLRAAEVEATEALKQVDAMNTALISAQAELRNTQDTLTSTQDTLRNTQQQVTTLQLALESRQDQEGLALSECRKAHEHEVEVIRGRIRKADEERREVDRQFELSINESSDLKAQLVLLQSQLQHQQRQQEASETLLRASIDDLHATVEGMRTTTSLTSSASLASLRASLQTSETARLEAEHACEQKSCRLRSLEMELKV